VGNFLEEESGGETGCQIDKTRRGVGRPQCEHQKNATKLLVASVILEHMEETAPLRTHHIIPTTGSQSASLIDIKNSVGLGGGHQFERDRQYPTSTGKYANRETTAANTSNANPI
jgi:hypothetical protein